jgi:multiple sugar transport system permease protein
MRLIKRGNRGWDRMGRTFLIYGTLAFGSLIFALPLLWMAGTSFKSGREIFLAPGAFGPEQPIARKQSPYLEMREFRHASIPKSLLPAVERRLRELNYPWPDYTAAEQAIPVVAKGILEHLSNTLPVDTWKLPEAELEAVVTARVDAPLAGQMLERAQRMLFLGQMIIRSKDIQEQELVSAETAAQAWHVEGDAEARLEPGRDGQKPCALLRYDFSKGDHIRLSRTFTTDFSMERLYRLQFYMRNDDSWHSLRVRVEKLGVLYEAVKDAPLAGFENWTALTWQEPGSDDQANKVKSWVLLKEIDRGSAYVSDPNSLKVTLEFIRTGPVHAWWKKITNNYAMALAYIPFWRYVATSTLLVLLTVGGTLFSCSLVGYSFARLKWPGRDLCFGLMLATLMIPPQITMIPQFLIIRQLGWYDTLLPLWVPHFFGIAFYVFLLRQFLKGIPRDLEEAARIDGCGFFRVYWHIMLPLVKPTMAAIAVLTFIGTWNDFMGPLIYINDQRLYPLSFGLYAFTVQASMDAGLNMAMTMAGSLLMTLPVIFIFIFAQKYFIQGVTLSGMKG